MHASPRRPPPWPRGQATSPSSTAPAEGPRRAISRAPAAAAQAPRPRAAAAAPPSDGPARSDSSTTLWGHSPTSAAVETQFAIPVGCPEGAAWHLLYYNLNTGALEYQDFGTTGIGLTGGGNKGFTSGTSGVEVFSSAAFGTPYRVHMEIDDVNRQLIVAADADVITPAAG